MKNIAFTRWWYHAAFVPATRPQTRYNVRNNGIGINYSWNKLVTIYFKPLDGSKQSILQQLTPASQACTVLQSIRIHTQRLLIMSNTKNNYRAGNTLQDICWSFTRIKHGVPNSSCFSPPQNHCSKGVYRTTQGCQA